MSDPKREKLEAEAADWLKRRFRQDDRDVKELADWAERREREAVAERDKEWRGALFPNTPTVAWTPEMAGKFKQKLIDDAAAVRLMAEERAALLAAIAARDKTNG